MIRARADGRCYISEMSDFKSKYERIRGEVEAADRALATALDQRVAAVRGLLALRAEDPGGYYSLPRDADVIARLAELVRVFPSEAVRPVLTEILSVCQRIVAPVEVVYTGMEGGFGHLAARGHFGAAATLRAVPTSEDVLSEVERGHCSFGLLPFETSYDGAVTNTVNLLARSDVKVCAEVPVRRAFHLLNQSGTADGVLRIYASASALNACERYLRDHFPNVELHDTRSGLVAADQAKQDPSYAALGTEVVAELSGLSFAVRNIEDLSDLHTRYVAVGNDYPPRTGEDRTAIALALHDAPGVLIDCLQPFAERKINIYRLETRPARGWEFRYLILIEVDGHITDRSLLAAIEALRTSSRYVKVLGSYPKVNRD